MGNGQCRPKNSPASLMKKRLQRLMCCFQSASTNSKASSCGMPARTKQLSPAFAKPRDGLTKDGTMIFFATARPARSSPNAAERSCAQNRALHALRSSEAHPQARSIAPPWPERGQRRVPIGRHCPKPEETGEAHPAPGADLRHMRRRAQINRPDRRRNRYPRSSAEGFFNTIRRLQPSRMRNIAAIHSAGQQRLKL
jgi:hypothetical protein